MPVAARSLWLNICQLQWKQTRFWRTHCLWVLQSRDVCCDSLQNTSCWTQHETNGFLAVGLRKNTSNCTFERIDASNCVRYFFESHQPPCKFEWRGELSNLYSKCKAQNQSDEPFTSHLAVQSSTNQFKCTKLHAFASTAKFNLARFDLVNRF